MDSEFRYTLVIGEQRHELPEGETTVGRSRTSGVKIDDDSVSRSHAAVHCRSGRVTLRDLGSSNGTHVGAVRVEKEIPVAGGDLVRFGTVLGRFEIESTRPSSETTIPLGNSCPACGARNPEGQQRCLNCTEPLPSEDPPADPPAATALLPGAPEPASPAAALRHLVPPDPAAAPMPEPRKERPTVRSSVIDFPLRPESGVVFAVPEAPRASTPRRPAAPGRRFAAALVDALVVFAIDLLFLVPALLLALIHQAIGQMGGAGPERLYRVIFWTLIAGALLVTGGYFVNAWAGAGRTFGQKRYGLRVEGPGGESPIGVFRALLRFAGLVFSVAPAGLGLLLVFSPRRRALHDLVAGTRVTEA